MSTPHNGAENGAFAKTVLMPGDPLRAKFIAETFLENPKFVVSVKGYDVLVGNDTFRFSRPGKNAFMEELTTWLAGSEGRR